MNHICKVHGKLQEIFPYFNRNLYQNFQEERKIDDINYLNIYQNPRMYYDDSSYQNYNFENFRYDRNYGGNDYYLYQNNRTEVNPLNKIERKLSSNPSHINKRKNKIINKLIYKKPNDLFYPDSYYNKYNVNTNFHHNNNNYNNYYNSFNNNYNYSFNKSINSYNDEYMGAYLNNDNIDKNIENNIFKTIDLEKNISSNTQSKNSEITPDSNENNFYAEEKIDNKENIDNNSSFEKESNFDMEPQLNKEITKEPIIIPDESFHLKLNSDFNVIQSNRNNFRFYNSVSKEKEYQEKSITKNSFPLKSNNIIRKAHTIKLKNKLNEEKEKKVIEDKKNSSKSHNKPKEALKNQSLTTNKKFAKDFKNKYSIKSVNMLSLNNFKKEELYKVKTLDNRSKKRKDFKSYHISKILENNNKINNNKFISNKNLKNKINININKKETKVKEFSRRKYKSSNLLSKIMKKECEICHKLIDSHLFQIHFNSHPSRIFDWLYLGTFSNACDIEELKRYNINYILNVALECQNSKLPSYIYELHLKIKDTSDFDIIDYFEEANDFIDRCRMEGGNLLIHCKYGISRSPAILMAYLIQSNKFSVDYALEFVKERRSKIKPNDGFLSQLYKYDEIVNEI